MKTASFLTALAAATAASTVALPAAAHAQAAPTTVEPMVPAAGTVLDVTAEGRTIRVPDLATIRAGVVSQSPTAAAALTDNAQRMAKVLAALKRAWRRATSRPRRCRSRRNTAMPTTSRR
jgi:uncharacterized protein YggE